MKNLKTFFELSNFDTKNITNKGSKVIKQQSLDEIENKGVTLEFLHSLNVPVFKYKTQITIHGLFPELKNNYLGGYKNLFQNKNLSIGVRWQAVDYSKKELIYKKIRQNLSGWQLRHNSSEFFIYKTSSYFDDKTQYKAELEKAKNDIQHIDKSLFFGNVGIYLSQTLYGSYFLVTYINIGGILESNVVKCIENITQLSMAEIEAKETERRIREEKEQQERKEKYRQEIEAKKAKQLPLMEEARKLLSSSGYTLAEKKAIENGDIFIKIEADTETNKFYFVAYRYSKEARQKKFRYEKAKSTDLNFEFSDSFYSKQETIQTTQTGWVKAKEKPKQASENTEKAIHTGEVTIVHYSEKAIALFGDTRPFKDKIKDLGGRFNPYLNNNGTKQAGWILPTTKIQQVIQLLK
jgi:hypothetical protein